MRNIYFTFLLLFVFTSCEDNNDDSSGLSPSSEDSQGNLVLINYSDYELVLYSGMDRIKILPASVEDFLVFTRDKLCWKEVCNYFSQKVAN